MLRLVTAFFVLAASIYAQDRVPVLLELFTSEGCSSCPPADALLAQLERDQPVPNVDVIVLSEHVDYWNSLGWKDPFSSRAFSERQEQYGRALRSEDVYTPQAVIDGRYATVGSRRQDVLKALADYGRTGKPALQVSVRRDGNDVAVAVPNAVKGDVWIALVQSKAASQVAHGENGGHRLEHVGVVRSLTKLKGGEAHLSIDQAWPTDLRLVAFVQDAHSGRILQVVQKSI